MHLEIQSMCETSKSGLGFAIGVDGGSVPRLPRRSPHYRASGHLHTDYFMGPRPPQDVRPHFLVPVTRPLFRNATRTPAMESQRSSARVRNRDPKILLSCGSICSAASSAKRRAEVPRCADARNVRLLTTAARPASGATGRSTNLRASLRWQPRPTTRDANGWHGPCGRRAKTRSRAGRTTRCA